MFQRPSWRALTFIPLSQWVYLLNKLPVCPCSSEQADGCIGVYEECMCKLATEKMGLWR
jgi:hypothetical protein